MAAWIVRATWIEDETEATEQWEVNAATAQEAIQEVAPRMRFQPHHVDIRHAPDAAGAAGLAPGQSRHRPAGPE